jgi:hypothetical protein
MTTDVRAVTWGSPCCVGRLGSSWRLDAEWLRSGLAWKLGLVAVGGSGWMRECPLAGVGVGSSDGTGFSNRSFDGVLTGAGRAGSKRFGLACVLLGPCGVVVAAEAGPSFNDKFFIYCDMSLAMLCCRKSSLR